MYVNKDWCDFRFGSGRSSQRRSSNKMFDMSQGDYKEVSGIHQQ